MKLTKFKEHDNGEVTIGLDMTEEEAKFLIEYAFKSIIDKYIEVLKNEKDK